MKLKSLLPRSLVILTATSLCFLVAYAALTSILHTGSMYRHQTAEQQLQSDAIISYMERISSAHPPPFLSQEEQSHMSDVKRLFTVAFIVYVCCIGVLLGIIGVFAYQKKWHHLDELLSKSLRVAGWTILAIGGVIGLASLLDFEKFWVLFHLMLFPQGNWMFPRDSVLITLYPASYFSAFVIRWAIYMGSFAIIAIILSYFMDRMRQAEKLFRK